MTNAPKDDGRVGYKRPPKHTRWKKGQCGNPKRRGGRRPRGTREYLDALLAQHIDVVENGIPLRITVFEAIVTQLWTKEIAGDKQALAVRLKYQEFAASQRPRERNPEPEVIVINI